MALVLEDGTGKSDGETWVSLADANAYWTGRNQPDWTAAEDTAREAALRNAADYIMMFYRWRGQPARIGQRLPWPRAGVPSGAGYFPTNAIPTQVVSAQLVAAVEALSVDLLRKPVADRQVIEETKGGVGFSKTTKFAPAPVENLSGLPRFPVIDQILRDIITSGGGSGVGMVKLVKRGL